MFAAVEFLGKNKGRELTIVPLIWLTDNTSFCYWPKTVKRQTDFTRLVKSGAAYQKSWQKYLVNRVLLISEDYDTANNYVNNLLDEGTTEDGDEIVNVTKKTILEHHSDDNDRASTKTKRKKKHQKHSRKHVKKPREEKSSSPGSCISSSQSSEGNDSDTSAISNGNPNRGYSQKSNQRETSLLSVNASQNNISGCNLVVNAGSNKENFDTPRGRKLSLNRNDPATEPFGKRFLQESQNFNEEAYAPKSAGSTRSTVFRAGNFQSFQHTVLNYLEEVRADQQENKQLLIQILHTTKATLRGPEKPDGLPDFPIQDLHEYELFDKKTMQEPIRVYIQNRLMAVGGTDLRNVVMGMMREIMADALATRFNWKGHYEKKGFEKSNLQSVIRESTKRFFHKKLKATDKEIIRAIQDWLKQAKNRLMSRQNRLRETNAN